MNTDGKDRAGTNKCKDTSSFCVSTPQEVQLPSGTSTVPTDVRCCWSCKNLLDIEEFARDRSRKSGRQSKCRRCSSRLVAAWRHRTGPRQKEKSPRRRDTRARQAPVRASRGTVTRQEESRLRDEGLTIRDRIHANLQQRPVSGAVGRQHSRLEAEADRILSRGDKPRT